MLPRVGPHNWQAAPISSLDDRCNPAAYRQSMSETPVSDRVWVEERGRWYPGILETWNTRDRTLRFWVSYAVPVNGWHGGWYEHLLSVEEDEDPNGEDRSWLMRVDAARGEG